MVIQRNVSKLVVDVSSEWSWSAFVTDMLDRAYELISINNYFDVAKVLHRFYTVMNSWGQQNIKFNPENHLKISCPFMIMYRQLMKVTSGTES